MLQKQNQMHVLNLGLKQLPDMVISTCHLRTKEGAQLSLASLRTAQPMRSCLKTTTTTIVEMYLRESHNILVLFLVVCKGSVIESQSTIAQTGLELTL